MEDFIQILVFLLFIILTIASSRKKKSKSQTTAKPKVITDKQSVGQKPKVVSKNKTNYLEELLGIQLPEPEPQNTGVPSYTQTTPYNSYEKLSPEAEAEYEKENEDGVSDYYENEIDEKTELNTEKDKHKAFKTESSFAEVEKIRHEINSMIADRSNLKNYIIIQEILNKPKALRR